MTAIEAPPAATGRHRAGVVAARPPAPARPPATGRLVAARVVAITLAALAGWFALHAFALSAAHERSAQVRLYGRLRSELAAATAPLGAPIAAGAPVALLDIPGASLHNAVIVEGTTSAQTSDGPGHLADTPLPGQAGTSVIYGRSLTFGAPFRDLQRLRPGDRIRITTQQGTYAYRVLDVRVPHDPLPGPVAPGGSRVVLITSGATGWRSGWAPQHAVYVDANLVTGQVQPVPAALPAVPPSALPMRGDTDALVGLVLWLELVVVVAGACAWGWIRWGRWQTWLIGAPLLLGTLWGATGSAELLLPNLL